MQQLSFRFKCHEYSAYKEMLRKERVLIPPMYREEMAGGNLPAEYKEAVFEQ